jgi:hypothetical protein
MERGIVTIVNHDVLVLDHIVMLHLIVGHGRPPPAVGGRLLHDEWWLVPRLTDRDRNTANETRGHPESESETQRISCHPGSVARLRPAVHHLAPGQVCLAGVTAE